MNWIDCEQEMPPYEEGKRYWCWMVPRESYWFSVPGYEHQTQKGTWEPHEELISTYKTREGETRFNGGCDQEATHWMPRFAPPVAKAAQPEETTK